AVMLLREPRRAVAEVGIVVADDDVVALSEVHGDRNVASAPAWAAARAASAVVVAVVADGRRSALRMSRRSAFGAAAGMGRGASLAPAAAGVGRWIGHGCGSCKHQRQGQRARDRLQHPRNSSAVMASGANDLPPRGFGSATAA